MDDGTLTTEKEDMPETEQSSSARFSWNGAREGARRTLPVALGIFAYGLVFGALTRQVGLSATESLLMSGLVFAGSSQFAVLGLWVAPLPVVAIILTTLVVNLRHLLMGAALRPRMGRLNLGRVYAMLFLMNDESWALTMAYFARGGTDPSFLLGSGIVSFVAWVGATGAGRLLGSALPD